jgi:hypothetical protein
VEARLPGDLGMEGQPEEVALLDRDDGPVVQPGEHGGRGAHLGHQRRPDEDGADGVFVGSGIFKSGNPEQRAAAIVRATTFFDDPAEIAAASRGLGEAMVGINVADLAAPHRLAERGW